MAENTRALLIEVAGYLTLISQGLPANRKEADNLLDKIGDMLAEPEPPLQRPDPIIMNRAASVRD